MLRSRIVAFISALGLAAFLYGGDVTGKWSGKSEQGPDWVFNLKSDGNKVTGAMMSAEGKEQAIHDGALDGESISFTVDSEWQGQPIKLVFKGKVTGDQMQLRIDTEDGAWGTDASLKRQSTS